MARQYFVEIGQPQRRHFIARRQSYHGNTLGALAVGGNAWRREQFKPLLMDVTHVAPCYEYRDRRTDETPEQYGQRLVTELSEAIDQLGGENVMAFVAETIGGATAGGLTPVPGYFKGVRELCDRHGILLILDEVMCGMGRSGTLHACEQEGVVPDLLTIAKGLGGGYQPIGAVLAQGRLVEAFRQGSGLFQGIELVADRGSKQWFDPARRLHARIKSEAMAEGLMVYPMGGTVDGRCGDHVLLAPPFISTEAELAQIVTRLRSSMDRAMAAMA